MASTTPQETRRQRTVWQTLKRFKRRSTPVFRSLPAATTMPPRPQRDSRSSYVVCIPTSTPTTPSTVDIAYSFFFFALRVCLHHAIFLSSQISPLCPRGLSSIYFRWNRRSICSVYSRLRLSFFFFAYFFFRAPAFTRMYVCIT